MDRRGARVRIRLAGEFFPGQVVLEPGEPFAPMPEALERHLADAWTEAGRREGIRLFDGPVAGLRSWAVRDGVLRLRVSPTGFRHFLGTHLSGDSIAERFGTEVMANAVGVCVVLSGGGGRLVLGKRSDKVAYNPCRIHPLAGTLEPSDTDPFDAIRRELQEEVRLTADDLHDLRCLGMVEDPRISQPELVFAVGTHVADGRLAASLNDEHERLAWVTCDTPGLMEAATNAQFTPVAAGALLLWGRSRFGDEWFDHAVAAADAVYIPPSGP